MKFTEEVIDRNVLEVGIFFMLATALLCEGLAVAILMMFVWSIPFLLEGRATGKDAKKIAKRVGIVTKLLILFVPLY